MACSNNPCRLCKRLVISQAVTYASGVLTHQSARRGV